MIKYNDNNVTVGYIKQLLHSTYIPNCPVYKNDGSCYDNGLYVKNDGIYQFVDKTLKFVRPYKFNVRIENYTKLLKLENNIYDWHTHEYLGEYLRFLKDYFKLNLMSLYNCFSGRMLENAIIKNSNGNIIASYDDQSYTNYIVPVKLNSQYSIYIETSGSVEVAPILYDKGYYTRTDTVDSLTTAGYKKYNSPSFKKPLIYDFLKTNIKKLKDFYKYENDLKLLIKVPFNCNSSIVILEDNYTNTQGFVYGKNNGKNDPYIFDANNSVINYEYTTSDEITDKAEPNPYINEIPLKTRSQLTYINSNVSHPFADRLLEYLTDNAITHLDEISDNIKRVQRELIRRKIESIRNKTNKTGLSSVQYEGIWEGRYKGILYDVANEEGLLTSNFDILGYVDKDVEMKLGEDYDLYTDSWYEESK